MTAFTMSQQQQKELKITSWFAEYSNRLLLFIRSKISDLAEAEDIAQEVWYQLSRQDGLDQIQQIGNWLFTTANNRVINFYKKKKNIPFSALEPIHNENAEDHDPSVAEDLSFNAWASESLPSELVESQEFWDLLQQMLLKLPQEQREVFIENELYDVSFRELSERTGTSINTLLARKSYAVKRLRKEFEKMFNA